jgi:hypothetical protein
MALTQINGNQISTSTQALITQLSFLNANSIFQLPIGTTAQRPSSVSFGTIRFNTTLDSVEVFKANSDGQGTNGWGSVGGGGPSRGRDSIVRTNRTYIDENLTIGSSQGEQFVNGMSVGPVTINNGFVVNIDSNAVWTII